MTPTTSAIAEFREKCHDHSFDMEDPDGLYDMSSFYDDEKLAAFLTTKLEAAYKAGRDGTVEATIGKIGAELLARHSSQVVIDAYFDVANDELEKIKEKHD